jgi:hypothetical protein
MAEPTIREAMMTMTAAAAAAAAVPALALGGSKGEGKGEPMSEETFMRTLFEGRFGSSSSSSSSGGSGSGSRSGSGGGATAGGGVALLPELDELRQIPQKPNTRRQSQQQQQAEAAAAVAVAGDAVHAGEQFVQAWDDYVAEWRRDQATAAAAAAAAAGSLGRYERLAERHLNVEPVLPLSESAAGGDEDGGGSSSVDREL